MAAELSIPALLTIGPLASAGAVDLTEGLPLFALAALAWLFTYALHSTLMLGSAWLATRRMSDARAGLRERIWKFAVVAAFVTASVQVGLGFEPLGGRLPLKRSAALAERPPPADLAPTTAGLEEPASVKLGAATPDSALWYAQFVKRALGQLEAQAQPALETVLQEGARTAGSERGAGVPLPSEPSGLATTTTAPAAPSLLARLGEWTQWAFATCMLGAFAGLCLFALLWLRLNGCLRDRVELAHGSLADKLRELCRRAGIRRRVRLSVAPSLGAPISMGMLRPEICIPPRVLLELSEEEQEALLAHELAHVVRRDPLWLATCRLCEGVFFFQPLNRVARQEIEDCAEFLSDAWAVRQTGLRFSLASCLTRIAEWIVGDRRMLPAPAMAHGRSRLRHRVELLLDEAAVLRGERRPRWLGVACTGFGATLIAVVPCVSARETDHDRGDGGSLAFLPEHDPVREAAVRDASCADDPEAGECAKTSGEICASDPVACAAESPEESLDLSAEIEGLAADFALLRAEAGALRASGGEAREITAQLAQMEMTLAHLRELNQRIGALRAALAPPAARADDSAREARASGAPRTKPDDQASTLSVNSEENSK